MNAARSFILIAGSGFLIGYGLFVLPWIEATYAAILPVLVSVLLILLVGQSRPGRHPASLKWLTDLYDLLLLAIGIAVLAKLGLWANPMDEGPTPLAVDGDPYFAPAIAGAIIVLLELTRRAFGWIGLGIAAIAAMIVTIFWFALQWEVQADVANRFDANLGPSILALVPGLLIAALVAIKVISWSTLPNHFGIAAAWIFRGSRLGPVYLALLLAVIIGGMAGGPYIGATVAAIIFVPLLKRLNLPGECAAALALLAAYSWQVMPPILSGSALTIADITGISYLSIITAVFCPAVAVFVGFVFVVGRDRQLARANLRIETARVPWPAGVKSASVVAVFVSMFFAPTILFAAFGRPGFLGTIGAVAALALVMGGWREFGREMASLKDLSADIGIKVCSVLVAALVLGAFAVAVQAPGVEIPGLPIMNPFPIADTEEKFLFILLSVAAAIAAGLVWMASLPALLLGFLNLGPTALTLGFTPAQFWVFLLFLTSYAPILLPAALTPIAAAKLADARIFGSAVIAYRWLLPTLIVPVAIALEPSLLVVKEATSASGPEFLWAAVRLVLALWLLATVVGGRDVDDLGFWDRLARFVLACAVFAPDPGAQISAVAIAIAWSLYHRRNSRLSALPG